MMWKSQARWMRLQHQGGKAKLARGKGKKNSNDAMCMKLLYFFFFIART